MKRTVLGRGWFWLLSVAAFVGLSYFAISTVIEVEREGHAAFAAEAAAKAGIPLAEGEIDELYERPERFRGRPVTLSGQILSGVESDAEGLYFQLSEDGEWNRKSALVFYDDTEAALRKGDFVTVTGTVSGEFGGMASDENIFGFLTLTPTIEASEIRRAEGGG